MRLLWVDCTTATPCVMASMKACWTSCSISRTRLLDLSRTHGNTIILLPFFEICIGFQFVKELSSNWRPWSTNVSTVCVHPTLQRTAYCCLPLVVGSTCDRLADWNCLFQEHELWHLARGLSPWQARGFGILCPLLWENRLSRLTVSGGDWKLFCSDSCNCFIAPLLCFLH